MDDRWLTIEQAARQVHRSPVSIKRWIREGELPAIAGRVRLLALLATEERIRERKNQHTAARSDARATLIDVVGDVVHDDQVARAVTDAILDGHDVKPKTRRAVP